MQSDHNIILEKSESQDLIIDQAIENSEQYSLYHFNKTLMERQTLQNTDSFMCELMDFFESRDFTRDIVDLIMQIAADAIGLNIYIYQENILQNTQNGMEESRTEIIKMSGGHLCKDVYLKFTHNNIHPQGNHYEPLLKTEERHESEKIHQNIIEIFGEDSTDEPCCTQRHIQPSQETEQCVVSNLTKTPFLNEQDDVIFVQEISDEQSVITIEEKQEVICSEQSLLD